MSPAASKATQTVLSASIPNFVNGVSQQPYELRLTSQGDSQINGYSTVASGLQKRPPTEHVATLSGTPITDAFIHLIDRDGSEQYQVIITPGLIRIFDIAGNSKTVNFTNQAYLNTTSLASVSYALTTVADYTFISNKTKKVAASTTIGATRPYEALINVKLGNYGKTHKILINNADAATAITSTGTEASESVNLNTDTIAANLYNGLVASGYNTAPWSSSINGSVIYIKNTDYDFLIRAMDGFNNAAVVAIKGAIQKFSDLPANAGIDGFTVQVTGDQTSGFDNYWVKYDMSGYAGGTWKETVQPGLSIGLDATTLPHVLIREANGSFTFKPATWTSRLVGDMKSNPNPSCVGATINDVFFFQNRLGFLSDENYIQTETGKYFNLFRTTVNTLLDSDPIDVTAATNKVAILQHAVEFNKQLLLFSNQQQFMVDSTVLMTPKRVPLRPTTNFPTNTLAKPVASGRNIYFSVDRGSFSSVREFYAETISTVNDASDISSHIPRYIPSEITKIAAGNTEDVMVILSKNDPTKLFIYKYYFSGTEKLQSSWSHWTFNAGGTILTCDFIKSVLYLVVSRSSGVYLEKIDFSIGPNIAGEPFRVLLDRKRQIPKTSLSYNGSHTIISLSAIGYIPSDGEYMVVAMGGGTTPAGAVFTVTYSGGIAMVPWDITDTDITFGQKYTFSYTLSTLGIRLPPGTRVETGGRTQVRNIKFNHADTGYYRLLVTPDGRPTYTYTFSGKYTGTTSATFGTQALDSDTFGGPVMSRNTGVTISLDSDQPLPVAILSSNWECLFAKHSTSV